MTKQSSAGVPTAIQWFVVVVSAGLSGLWLLGLALVLVEYRPSGASLLQQATVGFAAAGVSMCLSIYLLGRPLQSVVVSRMVYLLVLVAMGSTLAMYLRESWVWDPTAQLFAFLAALSAVTAAGVVISARGQSA